MIKSNDGIMSHYGYSINMAQIIITYLAHR